MRTGRQVAPDDALINAMGRMWILERAAKALGEAAPTDDDDELWDRIGLPWCHEYNEAYLATLEALAGGSS